MKTKIINFPDLMKALNRQKSETRFEKLNLASFGELSNIVKVENTLLKHMVAKQTSEMKKLWQVC